MEVEEGFAVGVAVFCVAEFAAVGEGKGLVETVAGGGRGCEKADVLGCCCA